MMINKQLQARLGYGKPFWARPKVYPVPRRNGYTILLSFGR
ncbi:MAG: hypothetical protein ABSC55_13155 [Syntrophorhabdales bacterium]